MWAKWVLVGWLAFSALVTVSQIGKPRDPITPSVATVTVAVAAVLILLVVIA